MCFLIHKERLDIVHNQILTAYTLDFAKHISSKDIPRLQRLWQNIQDNLAKEDRKFKYSLIERNARGREYENSVEWLVLSGLATRVYEVNTPRLPLSSVKRSNAFKLYLSDSGLLRTKFRLAPTTILLGNRLFTEFKGVLTENYVLQTLVRQFGNDIFYWTSGNQAEVEFLFQQSERYNLKALLFLQEERGKRSVLTSKTRFANPLKTNHSTEFSYSLPRAFLSIREYLNFLSSFAKLS